MKRMLVNATQPEEIRVAIVDGQKLLDLDIESRDREQRKGNVYTGKITRIEPSLEAAFVNYGPDRHGFLPLKEIAKCYFKQNQNDSTKGEDGQRQRLNIKDVIKEGQEIIVQVEKEERGNKGAALTTFISLAGRFLVLMPTNPRAGGVSRRIEGEDRSEIRQALAELTLPDGMGVIVRTAGVGRSTEELQWDLDYLINLWSKLEEASEARPVPCLVYQESNIIVRSLRDYFRGDIGEVQIDDEQIFDVAQEFMQNVMPHATNKLKRYTEKVPLFNRFQIESQIESAFAREVTLPSGGSIVIDHTEALTSIDINSARATKGSGIEDTAFNTNLEAAEEIARQLKIRDLGGLVVIDFIDMSNGRNQREVENRLKDSVKSDRARVQIGRISRFGLLEMSRQRLRPSLGDSANETCPRCSGHGYIRSTESFTLSMLRLISEEALKENTGRVIARLPVAAATYLLNEKRDDFLAIEERTSVQILIIPTPGMKVPEQEIERVRIMDIPPEQHDKATHTLARKVDEHDTGENMLIGNTTAESRRDEPAVKSIAPSTPAPEHKPRQKKAQQPQTTSNTGLFAAIALWFKNLFGGKSNNKRKNNNRNNRNNNRNRNRNNRNNNQGRGGKGRNSQNNRNQQKNQNRGGGQRGNRNNNNRGSGGNNHSGNNSNNDQKNQRQRNQNQTGNNKSNRNDGRNDGRNESRGDNRNQNNRNDNSRGRNNRNSGQSSENNNHSAEDRQKSQSADQNTAANPGQDGGNSDPSGENRNRNNRRRGNRGGRNRNDRNSNNGGNQNQDNANQADTGNHQERSSQQEQPSQKAPQKPSNDKQQSASNNDTAPVQTREQKPEQKPEQKHEQPAATPKPAQQQPKPTEAAKPAPKLNEGNNAPAPDKPANKPADKPAEPNKPESS